MANGNAEANQQLGEGAADLAGLIEKLASRLVGGISRLAGQANRSAQRVKHAAHELRASTVLQHAAAARERGNLEAAFWLFNEEFSLHSDETSVAVPYWDLALALGRADIASPAGVKLVETRAAAGEPELAAQHWLELVKVAPGALVSPVAIATILPALKARLAEAGDDGPDDRESLAGYLRRAVQHAVDPRNTGLHPGVALRIFEEGREINPEASRHAAKAALESPHLHEAKRERLSAWLGGENGEVANLESNAPPKRVEPEPEAVTAEIYRLSDEEIAVAVARLRQSEPAAPGTVEAQVPTGPANAKIDSGPSGCD